MTNPTDSTVPTHPGESGHPAGPLDPTGMSPPAPPASVADAPLAGCAGESSAATGPRVHRSVTICNQLGLHARAAAKFVKLAARYQADVTVRHKGQEACGISIMGLMMLAAGPGCTIEVNAAGPDAQPVLDALCQLVNDKFDEA